MENTIENKAKFFAQYYGQKVFRAISENPDITRDLYLVELPSPYGFLELKSLSSISDEDAKQLCARLTNVIDLNRIIQTPSVDLVKELVDNYSKVDCLFMLPASFTDKARELGYAIDWNDLKVSQQIEYGWVRLTK